MQAEVCPTDWQEVPLSSVADDSFSSVDKKSHAGELPVRLCNYVDVYKNEYITGDFAFMRATATRSEIAQFGVRLGDVIITKDSETPDDIGIAALVDYAAPDLVCGYHLAMLRPKTNRVAPAFLAKQLRHPRLARYFGQQANGLTRYGLPKSAVQNAPMWIPREPKEGEKVAEILRQLDAAIRETEAVVAKLRHVKAGLLHDLLTRGLDEHGHLRDPARHPEEFQVSPLGLTPKEWDVVGIDALASNLDGQRIPLKEAVRQKMSGEFPYYGASGIIDYVNDYIFDGDYVLLGEDGENVESRRLPLAFRASGKIWVNNHAHVLQPKAGTDIRFLVEVLEFKDYRRIVIGSAQPKITQKELATLWFQKPKHDEQVRIADSIDAFTERVQAETDKLSKLHSLKRGLAHDLLTGRVRVKLSSS